RVGKGASTASPRKNPTVRRAHASHAENRVGTAHESLSFALNWVPAPLPTLRLRRLRFPLEHASISCRPYVLAVEPFHRLERRLRRASSEHPVAQLTRDATRVIELAIDTRHDLHPPGAQIARRLIGLERGGEVALQLLDLVGEADRVLDRHAGALRQILQHG